jgi:hypothetical protein
MNYHFLPYVFFLLFTFQVNGMEIVSDSTDELSRLITAGSDATAHLPHEDIRENGSIFHINSDENPLLFNSLKRNVFDMEDPIAAKGCRWFGRGLGACATNAIGAMILYVVFNLFDLPKSGALEISLTCISLLYLLLPSVENSGQMGQMGHDIVHNCAHNDQFKIPEEFKGVRPSYSIPLTIASNTHASIMALILATVFHHIETSKVAPYSWFFWTFFAPYAAGIYYKNISFFNHGKRIEKAHHLLETKAEKKTRQLLEEAFSQFNNKYLRKLDHNDLEDLYLFLTNANNTTLNKLQKIKEKEPIRFNVGNDIQNSSRLDRQTYDRPWTIQNTIAKQGSNIVFYGSMIPEYVFYQFGLGLVCKNFGSGTLATDIISHTGAVILSAISFSFEHMSIRKFYTTLFEQKLGSSLSISNPILRKGIGIKSFFMSSFIALSEVYPSWKGTLAGNYASYPLLVLMVARHHARNTFWLQGGYDRMVSNYHLRDCWRNNSCCCFESCKTGKNQEEMINFISLIIHRMSAFSDQLNARGISVLYKAYFGYTPDHY